MNLRLNPLFCAGALLLTLGGCAKVLGLEDWQDPLAASSAGATGGTGGAVSGSGTASTSSVTSASTSTGVTATSAATSGSVGSTGVGSGAGGGDVSCADGIKNLDESDVDCGGSCILCGYDRQCNNDGDCASGNCKVGRCGVP
ncbi:MAG: hypothetical protein ABJE95_39935, partial [Byssovorax sp.]